MLIYDLEKKGDKPIYEYIYGCIRDDIRSGVLCSGDKLPSRRQMALDNGIAEITVSNAYSQLVTEGYIESRGRRDSSLHPISKMSHRRWEILATELIRGLKQ